LTKVDLYPVTGCNAHSIRTLNLVVAILLLLAAIPSIIPDYATNNRAFASSDDFTFVAAGEFGCSVHENIDGSEKARAIFTEMGRYDPEIVLGLGGYSHQEVIDCWHDDLDDFPTLHSIMHNPAFRPLAIGQSETACEIPDICDGNLNATGRADFLDHFDIQEGSTFHSFNYKGVHFLALDTNIAFEKGSPQFDFVKNDLEMASGNSSLNWIVVFFHRPMYMSECDACGAEEINVNFRNTYQPLFDRNRVDLVIAGGVPAYERFRPLSHSFLNTGQSALIEQITDPKQESYIDPIGQIHLNVGTGGRPVKSWSGSAPETANRVGQAYGFLKVEVVNSRDSLVGSFVDKAASPGRGQDSRVEDSFTLTRNGIFTEREHYSFNAQPEAKRQILVSSNQSLQLGEFTVASWFRTSLEGLDGDEIKRMIANKGRFGEDGNNMNYGIWIDGRGRVQGGFEAQNVAPSLMEIHVSSDREYNDGRWHYAVLTSDGYALTLFVDGVFAPGSKSIRDIRGTTPDHAGAGSFEIGDDSGFADGLKSVFEGEIDEVRVWNRALASHEVWSAYNGIINTNGLVLHKPASRPVAYAGPDQTITEGFQVTLTGSESFDPDGAVFSYEWTQTGGPRIELASTSTAQITFTAPAVGPDGDIVAFSLDVVDNEGLPALSPALVSIIVQDNPAASILADSGPDLSAHEGDLIHLNGSASIAPDGQTLTYYWVQTFGPAVQVENSEDAIATFNIPEIRNADEPVVLTFMLTISDGLRTSRDTITVTINDRVFLANGSQYRDYPDNELFQMSDSFSIAAWITTSMETTGLDEKTPIINKGVFGTDAENENMNYGIWMGCGDFENPECHGGGRIEAGFESANGTDVLVATPLGKDYADGSWHFVIVTYDGQKLKLFINDNQVNTTNTELQPDSGSTLPLRLGANSLYLTGRDYRSQYFTGAIDEISIWNRALTREEVTNIYGGATVTDGRLFHDDFNLSPAEPRMFPGKSE
jgi:hypothetical protein